jgi:hypothetical protein
MSCWIPPGYIWLCELVEERGLDSVRNDLFLGRLQAFQWDGTTGDLYPIEPKAWCSDAANRWIEQGGMEHRPILVRVEKEPSTDAVEEEPSTDGAYTPPFMALMQKAVQHFEISEKKWPVKKELEKFFREQEVDGVRVSANIAGQLATLCRPLAAMTGGNIK